MPTEAGRTGLCDAIAESLEYEDGEETCARHSCVCLDFATGPRLAGSIKAAWFRPRLPFQPVRLTRPATPSLGVRVRQVGLLAGHPGRAKAGPGGRVRSG